MNVLAASIVAQSTGEPSPKPAKPGEPQKNPHAVALGSLGGKKGGRARADKLTPEQRKEIARTAAQLRWQKDKGN